jgi:hypothetical protein
MPDERDDDRRDELTDLIVQLQTSHPEVYKIIRETALAFEGLEMHDIRRASLSQRLRASLCGRPGAGALVDELERMLTQAGAS